MWKFYIKAVVQAWHELRAGRSPQPAAARATRSREAEFVRAAYQARLIRRRLGRF